MVIGGPQRQPVAPGLDPFDTGTVGLDEKARWTVAEGRADQQVGQVAAAGRPGLAAVEAITSVAGLGGGGEELATRGAADLGLGGDRVAQRAGSGDVATEPLVERVVLGPIESRVAGNLQLHGGDQRGRATALRQFELRLGAGAQVEVGAPVFARDRQRGVARLAQGAHVCCGELAASIGLVGAGGELRGRGRGRRRR